jgi:hypothetical protein
VAGVFDELDIFERIALHEQPICECALFHNTKRAGIGIWVRRRSGVFIIQKGLQAESDAFSRQQPGGGLVD